LVSSSEGSSGEPDSEGTKSTAKHNGDGLKRGMFPRHREALADGVRSCQKEGHYTHNDKMGRESVGPVTSVSNWRLRPLYFWLNHCETEIAFADHCPHVDCSDDDVGYRVDREKKAVLYLVSLAIRHELIGLGHK
jgi:hypothetical protein